MSEFIDLRDKLPVHPSGKEFSKRDMSLVDTLTVHHSASETGKFGPEDFARWHISPTGTFAKYGGAPGICYHFSIAGDGTISQVNDLDRKVWHSINANINTIAVELDGNFEIEEPTKKQLDSLKRLKKFLDKKLKKKLFVKGHKDHSGNATACPGKNLYNKLNTIK